VSGEICDIAALIAKGKKGIPLCKILYIVSKDAIKESEVGQFSHAIGLQ
jgi:hypothetical protein